MRDVAWLVLASLLACGAPQRPAAQEPIDIECGASGTEPVGKTPTRYDVMDAMMPLKSRVAECGRKGEEVQVGFGFVSSGCLEAVPTVVLKRAGSIVDDPEVIDCVQRAAATARVVPFLDPKFNVSFPFRF